MPRMIYKNVIFWQKMKFFIFHLINIIYVYKRIAIQKNKLKFFKYFQKKAYYTKSMALFEEKNKGDIILHWEWRCVGVFFEKGKWKRFLSSPLMALCVLGTIFIRGIIYVVKK